MATFRHEVWRDPQGLTTLCLAGPEGAGARALLEPYSLLVHTIEANSHVEAMTEYYSYMGWGAYKDEYPEYDEPYPEDWAVRDYEVLPGLPATGPWPEQFSATGMGHHKEGLVVRFHQQDRSTWVGNFQRGLTDYDGVVTHPDGKHVIVIAGGQGYVVAPESREVTECLGGAIIQTYVIHNPALIVLDHQGIAFEALSPGGRIWRTQRLSWDGFRSVRIESGRMLGEAWSPMDDRWQRFEVDLVTGASSGGSFY